MSQYAIYWEREGESRESGVFPKLLNLEQRDLLDMVWREFGRDSRVTLTFIPMEHTYVCA